jgi:methionyl-tRNA formyltransferase
MLSKSKSFIKKPSICVIGCFEFGVQILTSLIDADRYDVSVVTITKEQANIYEVSNFFDYTDVIASNGLKFHIPSNYSLNSDDDIKYFTECNFDFIVIGGWNRLIPESILQTIKYCGIGIHGSPNLLPVGRGRSPMNWALINGENRFIMHLFKLTPGVDDGEILSLAPFQITEFDTIETLYWKSTIVIKRVLPNVIESVLTETVVSFPQQGLTEYYPRRRPVDGQINWDRMSMTEIYNFIRAQTKPYPGAYSYLGDKQIKIWDAIPFDETIIYKEARYGEIVEVFNNCLLVNCRGGTILLNRYDGILVAEIGMKFDIERG